MYDRVQKSSSSRNPSSTQKKKSSKYGPRTFTVQPRRETKSSQTPVPSYSPDAANRPLVTLIGSKEAPVQRQVDAEKLQTSSEQGAAPVEEAVAVSQQSQEVEIQRQARECHGEEKDSDEMSLVGVQAKLMVGASGDKYELEADRVAAQVMSMSVATDNSPQVQRFGEEDNPVHKQVDELLQMRSMVQRAFQAGGTQASGDLESRLNASKGGGSPLALDVRAFMEPRFGADFSSVRVHTGGEAVQMNRELGAQAFAHGNNIYFGEGKSPGNNELTAHELTHVVQQGQAKPMMQAKSASINDRNELEHEADVMGAKALQTKRTEQVMIGSVYQGLPSLQQKRSIVNVNCVSGNQLIQRVPNPSDANTFRAGLSPVGAIYKNTYDGSASTTIKSGWEPWSFERRWQLYDADDKLLDESYYTFPQPTYKIDSQFVRIGAAGGYEKPWSIWLQVTKTLVPFGGGNKENFPHSYITFPVFNTALDDTKKVESKSKEQESGLGIAVPKGKSPTSPANTKVTPDVALNILENLSRGEPPFKPELGKAGCSWFVTEGNPYTGIDPSKSIDIPVEIVKSAEKVVIDPAKLNELFTEMLRNTDAEAETQWRTNNKKIGRTLTPAQDRQLGNFKERFAESRMWDKVGEIIRNSKDKVGEVIVEQGRFSRTGAGRFAVVADAKMIQVKGGIPKLLTILNDAGISAEPVVVEAAEALAKKQKYAGRVRGVFRIGGKILLVVAIAADVYKIYHAEDKLKATITSAAGWAGATAAGAAFAAWFTPADTAGPWAWAAHGVGTLVAGGVGYWVGSETTRYIYELVPVN